MPTIRSPANDERNGPDRNGQCMVHAAACRHLWVDWIVNYTNYDVSTITEDIIDMCAATSIHSIASIITILDGVGCPITTVYGDIIHNTSFSIH